MVDLTDEPLARVCLQKRRQINAMFEEYRRRFIDGWTPRPCPSREEFK